MSRLNQNLKNISAYSVPRIECGVRLDGNESPFSLPDNIYSKIEEELKKLEINRYPDPECLRIRKQFSTLMNFPMSGIVIGNGSDELIQMIIATLCGGSGIILVPTPTFSMYKLTGRVFGKEVVEVELDENFDIDTKIIKSQIDALDPDLFFFATPNNPTGNCFSTEKIIEILQYSSGFIVIDEAYFDYSDETYLSMMGDYENLIILRTMSKIGFAALRLGILFANNNVAGEINKVRLPYNINAISQKVAEIVLDNYDFIYAQAKLIKNERERVYSSLKELGGLEVFSSDANFFLMRVNNSKEVFDRLVKEGILVRNLDDGKRLKNCLRVTIGTPEENDKFLSSISGILSS